ncbi:malonyl-CoA decarboxylase family protein [Alphaproteobacteria bacterium LSUCC0684]
MQMRFFNDILSSLMDGGLRLPLFSRSQVGVLGDTPEAVLNSVVAAEGEISSLVHGTHLLDLFESLTEETREEFFHLLLSLDLDPEALAAATSAYRDTPSAANLEMISTTAEPGWQEVFRRLNATPGGTVRLVRMREALIKAARKSPALKRLDTGLKQLMRGWFNPGFLVLKPITWESPASILEKIIAYEAVHEITSWDDLRARLAPQDRRCFAFFHPSMPDEPLIFVEVALMQEIPGTIHAVLAGERDILSETAANTAVFYSISNCQQGLEGISFGNFLIKRVAQELKRDLPGLKTFVTLSPVPGFRSWLERHEPELFTLSANPALITEETDEKILTAAARYFLHSDRPDGRPNDPVARFHLGNGAILDRLNARGDLSGKAIRQSAGLMVNYRYDLAKVEQNHEEYVRNAEINASPDIKRRLG